MTQLPRTRPVVSSLKATSVKLSTAKPVQTPSVVSGWDSSMPGTTQMWKVPLDGAVHVYQTETPPRSESKGPSSGIWLLFGSPVSLVASTVVPASVPLAPLMVVPGNVSFTGAAATATATKIIASPATSPANPIVRSLRDARWSLKKVPPIDVRRPGVADASSSHPRCPGCKLAPQLRRRRETRISPCEVCPGVVGLRPDVRCADPGDRGSQGQHEQDGRLI